MFNRLFKDKKEEIFTEKELEVLREVFDIYVEKQYEEIKEMSKDLDKITFSDDFKIRMNRLFRERVGTENIPHPEVDNRYEQIRSKIIRCWFWVLDKIKH